VFHEGPAGPFIPGRLPVHSRLVELDFLPTYTADTAWMLPQLSESVASRVFSTWYSSDASLARVHVEDESDLDAGWRYVEQVEENLMSYAKRSVKFQDLVTRLATMDELLEVLDETADKSPGRPWTMRYQTKGDVPLALVQDSLSKALDYWRRTGIVPFLCQIFMKDELIKKSKAAEGRYRGIVNVPFEILLLMAELDHDWHQVSMSCFGTGPYIVGINPFSPDWHNLYMRHITKPAHFEFDVSGAEFRFTREDFARIITLRKRYSSKATWERLDFLREFFCAKLLVAPDGRVDFCERLNPTGHYGTTQYTCRVVLRLLSSYVFYAGRSSGKRVHPRMLEVSIYGDNGLVSYDPEEMGGVFSPEGFTSWSIENGYPVKCSVSQALEDCTMLSHRFNIWFGRAYPSTDRPDKLLLSSRVHRLVARGASVHLYSHFVKLLSIRSEFIYGEASDYEEFMRVYRAFIDHVEKVDPGAGWLGTAKKALLSQVFSVARLAQ